MGAVIKVIAYAGSTLGSFMIAIYTVYGLCDMHSPLSLDTPMLSELTKPSTILLLHMLGSGSPV